MYPPRMLVIGLVSCFAITGCVTSPTTTPSPTPTPTVLMCTPEFGGEPFACTQADHDQMLRNDQRYAEAERVYRRYRDLLTQETVQRVAEPSEELLSLTTGHYRDTLISLRPQELERSNYSGTISVQWVKRTPVDTTREGTLALLVCLDRSEWVVENKADGSRRPQVRTVSSVQFDEVAGPRLVSVTAGEDDECV